MSGYTLPYSRRSESRPLPLEYLGSEPIDFDADRATMQQSHDGDVDVDDDEVNLNAGWSAYHHQKVRLYKQSDPYENAEGYRKNPSAYCQDHWRSEEWSEGSDQGEQDVDRDEVYNQSDYEGTNEERKKEDFLESIEYDEVIGYARRLCQTEPDPDESEPEDDINHVMEDFEELSDYVKPFLLEATTLSDPLCELVLSYLDDELGLLLEEVIVMAQRSMGTIEGYQKASKQLGEALPKPSKNALAEALEGSVPHRIREAVLKMERDAMVGGGVAAASKIDARSFSSRSIHPGDLIMHDSDDLAYSKGEQLDEEIGSTADYPPRLYLCAQSRKALRDIEQLFSLDSEQQALNKQREGDATIVMMSTTTDDSIQSHSSNPSASVEKLEAIAPQAHLLPPSPVAATFVTIELQPPQSMLHYAEAQAVKPKSDRNVDKEDFEILPNHLVSTSLIREVASTPSVFPRLRLEAMYRWFEREVSAWEKLHTELEARLDESQQEWNFAKRVQQLAHLVLQRPSSGIQVLLKGSSIDDWKRHKSNVDYMSNWRFGQRGLLYMDQSPADASSSIDPIDSTDAKEGWVSYREIVQSKSIQALDHVEDRSIGPKNQCCGFLYGLHSGIEVKYVIKDVPKGFENADQESSKIQASTIEQAYRALKTTLRVNLRTKQNCDSEVSEPKRKKHKCSTNAAGSKGEEQKSEGVEDGYTSDSDSVESDSDDDVATRLDIPYGHYYIDNRFRSNPFLSEPQPKYPFRSATWQGYKKVLEAEGGVLDTAKYLGRDDKKELPQNNIVLKGLSQLLSAPWESIDAHSTMERFQLTDPMRLKARKLLNQLESSSVPKEYQVQDKIYDLKQALKQPVYAYMKDPYQPEEGVKEDASSTSIAMDESVDSLTQSPSGIEALAISAMADAGTSLSASFPSSGSLDDWIYLTEPTVLRRRMTSQKHRAATCLVQEFLVPLAQFFIDHENDYMETPSTMPHENHARPYTHLDELRVLVESARIAVSHYYLCYMTRSWSGDDILRECNLNGIISDEVSLANPDPAILRQYFAQLVSEIGQDFRHDLTFTNAAMQVLQEASESYLTNLFRKGEMAKRHRAWESDESVPRVHGGLGDHTERSCDMDDGSLEAAVDADAFTHRDVQFTRFMIGERE